MPSSTFKTVSTPRSSSPSSTSVMATAGCIPTTTVRASMMRAIAAMSFDQAIAYTESQIALTAMTEDAKEGLAAFGAKRKPVWKGK